jgi:hypothetical protein
MSEPADVVDIVRAFLKSDDRYDGLVECDGQCACQTLDLAPCGEMRDTCEPGHLTACSPDDCAIEGKCDWHIAPGPRP